MDAKLEKAFDFAQDTTKQLITLSSAILALTITFVTELVGDVEGWPKYFVGASWILNIVSIVCGLLTLMALTAELEPKDPSTSPPMPSIRSSSVVSTAVFQVITFLAATTALVIFAIASY
ncbi:MAG: hypothetical protein M3280_06505 [Actinomycetota bacterium]|nr:hypothetical protein [Actinomycetota bacterium]